MASQLLPLGMSVITSIYLTRRSEIKDFRAELIDKCVGSRIWVVMKGDKGKEPSKTSLHVEERRREKGEGRREKASLKYACI